MLIIQNPHTPKRIHELNPNMKLILLLRNPVDRAFSHYKRKVKNNSEKLSFEEANRKRANQELKENKKKWKKMKNIIVKFIIV